MLTLDDKYTNSSSSPCFDKPNCQFDSRVFFEYEGKKYEEVTVGNSLYQYEGLPFPEGGWKIFELTKELKGDFDLSGEVDFLDFLILLQSYDYPFSLSTKDLNNDRSVNGMDFGQLVKAVNP